MEVEYVSRFPEVISLQDLRDNEKLADMLVLKKGQRLSVQPVEKKEFDIIKKMSAKK
ncbi:EVE domain protein [compost metagenome]